jgi:CubicO group peptidase (beta-lactamase class C family)
MHGVGHTFRTAAVALLAIVVFGQHGWAQQQSLTLALFERYLETLRTETGMPGLSAAIIENGTVIWDRGFGHQDVENLVVARADTPYPVLGLTETVASAVLLQQCVDEGDLRLTDTARQWSAEFPDSTSTVGDVLRHRSGGSFRYDPARYAHLSGVITQCARERYQRLVGHDVLSRFGMTSSVPGHNLDADRSLFTDDLLDRYASVLRRVAVPYRVENGRPSRSSFTPNRLDAATGLVSTVQDLARLDNAWSVLLTPGTLSQAWSASSGPTGLGWFVQRYNGHDVVWHFGTARDAYSSLILKVPSKNVTLILLANSDRLSVPYALENGDVTQSLFARLFLRLVLP